MALVDLSGVGGGLPRATPAEVVQVKLKSNEAKPTSARVGEVHLRYCAIYIKVLRYTHFGKMRPFVKYEG